MSGHGKGKFPSSVAVADTGSKWHDILASMEHFSSKSIDKDQFETQLPLFVLRCIDYMTYAPKLKQPFKAKEYTKKAGGLAFGKGTGSTLGGKTGGMFGSKTAQQAPTAAMLRNQHHMVDFSKAEFDQCDSEKPLSAQKYFLPSPQVAKLDQTTLDQMMEEHATKRVIEEDEVFFNYPVLFEKKAPLTENLNIEDGALKPIVVSPNSQIQNDSFDPIEVNSIIKTTDQKNILHYSRAGLATIDILFQGINPTDFNTKFNSDRINIGECFVDVQSISGIKMNYTILFTIYSCWPKDENGIRSPNEGNVDLLQYEETLRDFCERNNADFIYYLPEEGIFHFQVSYTNKTIVQKTSTLGIYNIP